MHLRSVKQQLANRTGCSIAEVDHHDTWQRAQPHARVRHARGGRGGDGCSTRRSGGSTGSRSSVGPSQRELVHLEDGCA